MSSAKPKLKQLLLPITKGTDDTVKTNQNSKSIHVADAKARENCENESPVVLVLLIG